MSIYEFAVHDPAVCTRVPCGRCKPKSDPQPPPAVDHDVSTPTDHHRRQVHEQASRWRDVADLWSKAGAQMLVTADNWQRLRSDLLSRHDGADDEQDEARRASASDDERNDRRWDEQAAGYAKELAAILGRVDADLTRLTRLEGILCPDQPKQLGNRDLLAAQVAADGWCVSCHRDDGYCEPVWESRSRDGCQWCARWRTSEGAWPPVALVRWRHRNPGRALTTADVARLLGKAS